MPPSPLASATRRLQVMENNVGHFPDVVLPVQAAIVADKTAAEKDHLTFKGESNQYWGFRVDHDGTAGADTVTYDVPTKSLAALRVRPAPCAAIVAAPAEAAEESAQPPRVVAAAAGGAVQKSQHVFGDEWQLAVGGVTVGCAIAGHDHGEAL